MNTCSLHEVFFFNLQLMIEEIVPQFIPLDLFFNALFRHRSYNSFFIILLCNLFVQRERPVFLLFLANNII